MRFTTENKHFPFSVPKLNLETVELLEKTVYVGLQSLIDREQTVL